MSTIGNTPMNGCWRKSCNRRRAESALSWCGRNSSCLCRTLSLIRDDSANQLRQLWNSAAISLGCRLLFSLKHLTTTEMTITEAREALDKFQAQIIHGPTTFREIGDVLRDMERKRDALQSAVEPLVAACYSLTDTDDWRGVAKIMVRCHNLMDTHPELFPENAQAMPSRP